MADPMKIRAKLNGDIAEVRILMGHPMENGLAKNADGSTIPAHFIQTMTVTVGGKTVVDGSTGQSVSRNPVFGFKVRGAKAGDKVVVTWKDNKGETRTDEAVIN